MFLKFILPFTFILHITGAFAGDNITELKNIPEMSKVCGAEVTFIAPHEHRESNVNLSETVQINIAQYISKKTMYGAKMASNVQCQSLSGAKYTGSEQEWKSFFKSTGAALSQKGAKNLQLTITGTATKVYQGKLPNREYKFSGDFKEGSQVILNLAVLDLKSNTMYSISVSGGYKIESYIIKEFQRIVDSFTLH